ncbi:cell wall-binding repeat-containing protein [Homoserinimonas sp. OAct 916]|uniref:cell wall-binding repeat-containing protein n=1 Tax=Homoserinimonas sp. OAct 916 TaxID=2211450 RepID=UPI0018E5597C|nr:cell wall-binding repeat-containing protein [Homoserinimonas sp. OAct 916]
MVLTGGVLVASPASAAAGDESIAVTPGENIQGAINDIASGGVITLAPGEYDVSNTLRIVKSLTLRGSDDGPVILKQVSAGEGKFIDIFDTNDVVLENFALDGSATTQANKTTGIDVNSVNGLTLSNVTVADFKKNGISVSASYSGTETNQSQNIHFNNVTVVNSAWAGIAFYTKSSLGINTDISDVTFAGVTTLTGNARGIQFGDPGDVNGVRGTDNGPVKLGTVHFTGGSAFVANLDDSVVYLERSSSTVDGNAPTLLDFPPTKAPFGEATTTLTLVPVVMANECVDPQAGGVASNLNFNGWTIPNSGAEFVEGGLKLTSDAWEDIEITRNVDFKLADARNLMLDPETVPAGQGLGIILETASGALHWEGIYASEFWSNDAVLPFRPTTGQGGDYSGSLQDALDTIGNVDVTKVTVLYSAGELNSVVLRSAGVNCASYFFNGIFLPSVPEAPSAALEGHSDIKVTWTAPASDGGSAITEYTVTLTPTTGGSSPLVATVGAGETSHVFADLTAALSYTATVAATNSAGTSAKSAASNAVRTNIQLCEIVTDGGVSTNGFNAANGWASSAGSAGRYQYVENGLHVWTTSNAPTVSKVSGYKSITPISLAQLGEPSIEFASHTGVRPSIQLRVSKTGSSIGGNYVVGEPWAYDQWMWWSATDFGVGGGLGYKSYGTLTDYLAANPNAKVNQIGYSLGSGVLGDATITSITVGCAEYTFDLAPVILPGTPTISGNAVFGSVLTANPGTDWTPTDATFTYQWYRDGVSVGTSGRSMTYTPVAADIGKKMTVIVTGAKTDYTGASAPSAPTGTVVPASMAGQSSISGTTVVGDTLTAETGTWNPSNATFTYQWFRNGVAISGATAKTYVLASADMRAMITVAITGLATSYSAATLTSGPTGVVTVPAVVEMCTDVDAGPLSTNIDNNGWNFSDTRATGHNDFVADGLHVWTEGDTSTDKTAGYRALSIPLADVGSVSMDLSNGVAGLPSIQLGVDRDGNGTWDGYLVNEGDLYGAGMWWTNKSGFGVPAGGGYDSLGTLDEYIAANPNARVVSFGYSLGSGLKGSAVIHSITVGCVEYSFEGRIVGATPTISGPTKVDQVLTADGAEPNWSPTGVTFGYQWLRNGNPITGATATTYTLVAADQGAKLSVSITGSKTGYTDVTKTSAETATIAKATFVSLKPVIDGTAQVGQNLTATDPEWTPVAPTKTYQWFVDGVAVTGATSKVYTVAAGDLGKNVTFTVTGTKPGYTTATATSLQAGPVIAGTLSQTTPKVTPALGVRVGNTVSAIPGDWGPAPVQLTYQWFADTVLISGAIGSSYTIQGADSGKRISVRVTGTKTGYTTASKPSGGTDTVQRAGQTSGAVSITGKTTSGSKLTASVTGWTPADAQLGYQWYRNGALVTGATGTTYTLGAADVGSKMTVNVTGKKVGYGDAYTLSAPTAVVTWAPTVKRIQGDDRYVTAINISKAGFTSAKTVFVATGQDYPDALSAAPVAAKQGGPLLLTLKNSLPASVANEIKRLKPTKIVIVGGSGAVSNAVMTQLKKIASTERVWGNDRYATSYNINTSKYGFQTAAKAYVATGQMFPDALSASAAGAAVGAPVILVNGSAKELDGATKSQLSKLKVKNTIIAGGTAAVSTGVANGLKAATGVAPDRRGGSDRYETSRMIGADVFAPAKSVYLATGAQFPDALAGAVLSGQNKGPLYLVQPNCVPKPTLNQITAAAPSAITLFGGTGALSNNVADLKACK